MNETPVAARRVLVLGASSQIAAFLLPRLEVLGAQVTCLSRSPGAKSHPGRVMGLAELERQAERGRDPILFDIVISLAPLAAVPPLISSFAGCGVRRLIAFGSTGRFYKADSRDDGERAVIAGMVDAEEKVATSCARHSIEWTLLRPTLVYGCGQDRNIMTIARFVQRFGFFPLCGGGRGLRQPVHADDLAWACCAVLEAPRTYSKSYNLSGGSTVSYRAMVEAIFAGQQMPVRLIPVPEAVFRAAIALASAAGLRGLNPEMASRMRIDMCFDHSEAARDFGFAPRPFKLDAVALGRAEPVVVKI